jgi:hypothetical protein
MQPVMLILLHVVNVLLLGTVSLAGKVPHPPGLTYLYTVNITGGTTANIGPGPRGTRVVVPIVGGKFSGPKLKGKGVPLHCSTTPD